MREHPVRAGLAALLSAVVSIGGVLVAGSGGGAEGFRIEVVSQREMRGHGYRISTPAGPVIHQPHLPAVPGKVAFATAEDARTVAELVVRRLEAGVYPPSVSREDLVGLGIQDPPGETNETRRRRE